VRTPFFALLLAVSIGLVLGGGCAPHESPPPTPSWLPALLQLEHNQVRQNIRESQEMEARIWGEAQGMLLPATDTETGWEAKVIQGGSFERYELGCNPYSHYNWTSSDIIRVRCGTLPCYMMLRITNPENGIVLYGGTRDCCWSCPSNRLELSRAGMGWLCGLEWPEICDKLTGLIVEELR